MSNADRYPEQLHEPNLGKADFLPTGVAADTSEIKPAQVTQEIKVGEVTYIAKPFPLTDENWQKFVDSHMAARDAELPPYTVSGVAHELSLMNVPQPEALRVASELVLTIRQQQKQEAAAVDGEIPPPPKAPSVDVRKNGARVVWSGDPREKPERILEMKVGELAQALQAVNSLASAQALVERYNRQWFDSFVETAGGKTEAVPNFEVVLEGKHYGMSRKFGPKNSEQAFLAELGGE